MVNKTPSGLDIKKGDDCSANAFSWAKTTFKNRPQDQGNIILGDKKSYSSLLRFGNEKIGITSDGIGTKIELAERLQKYDTLGFDLVAMVADDLVTVGLEPTSLSNILDVDHLDQTIINSLMQGLAAACAYANISMTGGEIAELGNRVGGYGNQMHFNWAATAIGVLPPSLSQAIDGTQIEKDHVVLALQSDGFRSNGFSLVRKVMQAAFGDEWHQVTYNKTTTWGEKLLTPSKIYTPFIQALVQSKIELTGVAHITGGGILQNLNRILEPNQKGAVLNNLFAPHDTMQQLIDIGNLTEKEAYLYWNMGNGMLLVAPKNQVADIKKIAVQQHYKVQVAGVVTDQSTIDLQTYTGQYLQANI